jgi:hypothetical protein
MPSRRIAVLFGLFVPLASAAGCSLINAYDAVKEAPGDDSGTGGDDVAGDDVTGSSDGTTASESGGGAGEASSDVVTDVTASSDGASEATMSPEAAADAGLPAGAVVIGGHVTGTANYVLSVLDPVTGNEKSRTPLSVLGIAYEGARDLWFIFDTGTSSGFPTTGTSPVLLHVRTLDTRPGGTWAWTELATLTVPQPLSGQYVVPLVDRLVYISTVAVDGPQGSQLTSIDTTGLDMPVPDGGPPPAITSAPLSFNPVGLVGTPPNAGVGGNVAILQNTSMTADASTGEFQFVSASIGLNGIAMGGAVPLGPAPNQQVLAGFGTAVGSSGYSALFAVPFLESDAGITCSLQQWTLNPPATVGEQTFTASGSRYDPIAFSFCPPGVAFIAEGVVSPSVSNIIYALPLGSSNPPGTYTVQSTNTVTGVVFEPYTNTVVATADVGSDNFILGLRLGGGMGAPPTLTDRGVLPISWSPPTDLVPTWVSVRQPSTFQCP